MSLIKQIKSELLAARKDGTDKVKTSLLTTLVGEAQMAGFNDGKRDSTDEEVQATIRKFVKGLKETIDKAESIGINCEDQHRELAILYALLPQQMSEQELRTIIGLYIEHGINTKASIMKALKDQHTGKFDGKLASTIVTSMVA